MMFSHPKKILLLSTATLAFAGGMFLLWSAFEEPERDYPELALLRELPPGFAGLSRFFSDLAEERGAEYAYELLKVAPVPPGTDMHLLGHVVGEELYRQKGVAGIRACTQDFRNACSHSIVVGLFSEEGEAALPEIADACRKAPGGAGAYTMCFHGLGHGVLSQNGYDLERTVAACKKTGTPERNNREYVECVGGAIMELLTGGANDPQLWKEKRAAHISPHDPLAPCSTGVIPTEAKQICYIYLTPHLFKAAGADLARPSERDFEKAFTFCGALTESDLKNRDACYGGFGKEFVVLAPDRDIRKVEDLTEEQLQRISLWCRLADTEEGAGACVVHALNSLYWGGENRHDTALRFCAIMDEPYFRDTCHANLIGAVSYFVRDARYRREFCGEIPAAYRDECEAALLGT